MAMPQDLDIAEIDQTLATAVRRQVPVTLTVLSDGKWASLHSRLLFIRDNHLLLEMPINEVDQAPHEFVPAEKVGASFKLKHYKHVFTAVVAGFENVHIDDGVEHTALCLCSPTKMQRIQRRVYLRTEVPPNRIVRATFWLGGRDAEPAGGSIDRPVWFGQVTDLSGGGFQLRSDGSATQMLEVGDPVGVRLSFGPGETVFADAQFRHAQQGDNGVLLGFQFIALDQTAAGQRTLTLIGSKIAEYQRILERSNPVGAHRPAAVPQTKSASETE